MNCCTIFCVIILYITLAFATCTPGDIDFSEDKNGNPLSHGDVIDSGNQPWGPRVQISGIFSTSNDDLRVFDTSNPDGIAQDKDLGTPNKDFGGDGEGTGGKSGEPGENSEYQGFVLIINGDSDNSPEDTNDEAAGGTIVFDIDPPATVIGMGMVDADRDELDNSATLFFSAGGSITIPLLALGDNSYQYIFFNEQNNLDGLDDVEKIEVVLDSSGSISALDFCSSPPPLGAIGDTVWHDDNRNAVVDGGELLIEGVLVAVYPCDTLCEEEPCERQIIAHDITDENGYYYIGSLPTSCYNVSIPAWDGQLSAGGQVYTYTSTPEYYVVNLVAPEVNLDCDFGFDFIDDCPGGCFGDKCTTSECVEGTGCVDTDISDKCDEGDKCFEYSCDPATGCTSTDISDTCDGGDKCFEYSCDPATGCTSTDISDTCDEGNKCFEYSCDPETGCTSTDISDSCDKGDKCIEYSCDPEVGCVERDISGECDDNDDCTEEYCDPDFGCRYSGVDCDDSDVCTRDYCLRNGGCQHEDLSDECNDFNVCTTDSCDPKDGCSNVVTTTCEPRNACETAECDPIRGCVYLPIECPGSSTDLCKVPVCDENTGCSLEDFSCPSDGDLCTDEKCNPDTGLCTSTEIVCDDEDPDDCIISYCDAGNCVSSSEPDCDDGNPCTIDSCKNFNCVHTPIVCNSGDACFPQVCIDGDCVETPIECPDSDADCEGTICVNGECVPKNDNNCDDGLLCTTDVCTEEGKCVHSTNTCNDDNLCTADSCDPETGECINTIINTDCVNDACFERKCDPATGNCIETPIVDCSTDNVCASGECNPDTGLCEVTEFDCDDGLFCTIDICEEDENENPSCRHEQRVCPQTSDLCVVSICSEDSDSCEELSVVCASEDECLEGECIDGNCVFRRLFGCGIPIVPDPVDPVAIEDPLSSSSTLIIPVAGIVNNAAGGGDSGAVANEASAVLANNYSTTVVAVGGVGLVITFAFFAAVLGFNNSKQQPEVPLDALLDQTEADMVAFDNPLGTSAPDANINIASV